MRQAMNEGLTCEKGRCEEKVVRDGKEITEICPFKPPIKPASEMKGGEEWCGYYLGKYDALTSQYSLWNYHSFFQTIKFNRKTFDVYLNRAVSIFDEAHKIEDQIVQFIGFDIFSGHLRECGLNPSRYDFTDIDSMVTMTNDIALSYATRIGDIKESPAFQSNPDFELIARLERQYDKAAQARIDILSDKDNFVINDPQKNPDGTFKMVSIKPVDISRFASSLLDTEYQVFMSATIDKASFCENIGLDPEKVAMVDVPRSPFPVENRRIDLLNIRRLNYSSTTDDEMEVIRCIDDLLDRHAEHRGLILTSSIPRCRRILQNLSGRNARRIRICHSTNSDGRTQDEIIDEHRNTRSSVLLSSSLWEGVDLSHDLSRFQIIAKVPYPNYTERRTKAKMEKFPLWYTSQTLTKLLQGFGRSIRSHDDWAKTYVLDTAANNIFFKGQRMIPKAYHDSLNLDYLE